MGIFDLFKPNVEKLEKKKDVKRLIKALKYKPLFRSWTDKSDWDVRNVRESAAKALGEIRDSRAVEPLIQLLKDKDSYVRKKVVEALGKIGGGVEAIIQASKDKDIEVREAAKEALERIKAWKS